MRKKREAMNELLERLSGQDVIITYGMPHWEKDISIKGILTEQNNEWIVAVKIATTMDDTCTEEYQTIWIDVDHIVSIVSRDTVNLGRRVPKVGDKFVAKNLYKMKDPIGKEIPFYMVLEVIGKDHGYTTVEYRNPDVGEGRKWIRTKILTAELKALTEWGCIEIEERGDSE